MIFGYRAGLFEAQAGSQVSGRKGHGCLSESWSGGELVSTALCLKHLCASRECYSRLYSTAKPSVVGVVPRASQSP